MVWPLLAQIGVALLKQDADQRDQHEMRRRAQAQIPIDIMAMRAARAGDSGYMQRALGATANLPRTSNDMSGLVGVAAGLLSQESASDAEEAAKAFGSTIPQQQQPEEDERAPAFASRRRG